MKRIVVGGISCEVTPTDSGRHRGIEVWAPNGMCYDGGEHSRRYGWDHAKRAEVIAMAREDLAEAELQECECEDCTEFTMTDPHRTA